MPNRVVSDNTTYMFKSRTEKFWHNQDIVYNFKAQMHGMGRHSEVMYEVS